MNPQQQNSYLTHRANAGAGRHGWLRLTPAYSVRLVRERTGHLPAGAVVTDPFSGTGTTILAAAEHGCDGRAVDVNPFLVWLGNAKAARYPAALLAETRASVPVMAAHAAAWTAEAPVLWAPNLHNIDRWWSPGSLAALKGLRRALDEVCLPAPALDLLGIAFCRTAIAVSNAAFNHQSMSLRTAPASATAEVTARFYRLCISWRCCLCRRTQSMARPPPARGGADRMAAGARLRSCGRQGISRAGRGAGRPQPGGRLASAGPHVACNSAPHVG